MEQMIRYPLSRAVALHQHHMSAQSHPLYRLAYEKARAIHGGKQQVPGKRNTCQLVQRVVDCVRSLSFHLLSLRSGALSRHGRFGSVHRQDHSDLFRDDAHFQSRSMGGLGGFPVPHPRWHQWRFASFLPQQAGVFTRLPQVLTASRPRYADRTTPDDVSGTEVCLCQARSNRLDNRRIRRERLGPDHQYLSPT